MKHLWICIKCGGAKEKKYFSTPYYSLEAVCKKCRKKGKNEKIHYFDGDHSIFKTACGLSITNTWPKNWKHSIFPKTITCKGCMRTKSYRKDAKYCCLRFRDAIKHEEISRMSYPSGEEYCIKERRLDRCPFCEGYFV